MPILSSKGAKLNIKSTFPTSTSTEYKSCTVRYWRSEDLYPANADPSDSGTYPSFPEDSLPGIDSRPSFGICFSGGGTRSAVASFGIMRALRRNKADINDNDNDNIIEKKIKYTSAVSGGAWFTTPYTFLKTKFHDDDFFGEALKPESIDTLETLRANADSSLFLSAASDNAFWSDLLYCSRNDTNWVQASGKAFLRPFDLDSNDASALQNKYFTWSESEVNKIISKNPFLKSDDFNVVQRPRPYSILGGSMFLSPVLFPALFRAFDVNQYKFKNSAHFEITPLYSGVFPKNGDFGGGVIESFGVNKKFKKTLNQNTLSLYPKRHNYSRFTLSEGMGATSSAVGAVNIPIVDNNSLSSDFKYWPFYDKNKTLDTTIIDGGYLENLGIMPLLRRKVKKIIVCNNRGENFSGILADIIKHNNSKPGKIDVINSMSAGITHLFGVRKPQLFNKDPGKTNFVFILTRYTNHVISNANNELNDLFEGFKLNNAKFGVNFHLGEYEVIENSNYGIKPYKVKILWYELNSSKLDILDDWEFVKMKILSQLEGETTSEENDLINKVNHFRFNNKVKLWFESKKWFEGDKVFQLRPKAKKIGSLRIFPNYKTTDVNLSKEEVSLLSNFTDWCFDTICNIRSQSFIVNSREEKIKNDLIDFFKE